MNTTLEPQGTVRDILYIIFKHKVKMLILFFTVVLTVTAGSFLMSPTYEASSKILLKFGRENVYIAHHPRGGGSARCFWTPRVKSASTLKWRCSRAEVSWKRSSATSGAAAIYPGIDKPPLISLGASAKLSPADRAFVIFQKKLSVEAVKKSNIIDIKFQHKDPAVAARVVNRLVEVFLDHHLKVYQESGGYDFFIEQVNLCEKKLKNSEEELKAFKSGNNITALQEQKSVLLKQISEIETELAKTQGEHE